MQKKIITLLIATAFGACLGGLLGYGPLLRYKAEGVLNIEMGTSEYKRFMELANDSNSITQFAKINPLPQNQKYQPKDLLQIISKGEWYKPLAKVSKLDSKELSDAVLQMERDSEKEKEKENSFSKDGNKNRKPITVYLGLKLNYIASDPQIASDTTVWLGNYFKEVATREAVREQVSRWSADNLQFADRALEQKLKYEFEIEQAKTRVASLKKIIASYPDNASKQTSQVVDVRKDNEKFMSPIAQLVGSESEIIDITEKIKKISRDAEQQQFASIVLQDVREVMKTTSTGSESVGKLASVLASSSKKISSDAEREKLLSFTADLSQISARFLTQAQFIAQPSVPTRAERPTPLMYIVLFSFLSMLSTMVYLWRDNLVKFLKQDTENN